ncbi:hypothetical protein TELCIR_06373 [Teladorsagia circumcincta]|uniref:RNA-directed DNA polymerase n=1 Tax=Teladorsagia circumcincta TaxID=45464 RepID=A0A2G9UN46_TELCI|nr:hypothetical protein TELCIR_06373 [Teladorsagia circumcincta]
MSRSQSHIPIEQTVNKFLVALLHYGCRKLPYPYRNPDGQRMGKTHPLIIRMTTASPCGLPQENAPDRERVNEYNKKKKKQKPRLKRRRANDVVIALTHVDAASISRIYRPVQINGKTTRMLLDAGAVVTLLSHADWIAIGRPTWHSPQTTLRSANNKPINVRGCYECNFVIDGQHGRSTCYRCIDALISGLDEAAAYLDDILDYGFCVLFEKCNFRQTQIKYLGFVIDAQGRRPDPTTHFVRRPYEGGCCLHVDTEVPISFAKIRAVLNSDLLLTHYVPNLPIIVAADASNYGIGATLSHRFPDGSEKVAYHVSRCLTPAQKNYSHIEKKALALILGVQKFHRFVHRRHFTLKTDHKPLVALWEQEGNTRLQCQPSSAICHDLPQLQPHDRSVNTKHFGQVDAVSRLIASHSSTPEGYVIANVDVDVTAKFIENCRQLPVSTETILTATKDDSVVKSHGLHKVWKMAQDRSRFSLLALLQPTRHSEDRRRLSTYRITYSDPKTQQRRVLHALHKVHPGQTRMKMLARSYVYWPTLDNDIEQLVRNQQMCLSGKRSRQSRTLHGSAHTLFSQDP